MSTIIVEDQVVHIPPWVRDHKSFRRWARSDSFPEHGRYAWLGGELWADLSMEEIFTHNLLKAEYTAVLAPITRSDTSGYFLTDGMLYTHVGAALTTEPDGLFVSYEAIESKRVKMVKGKAGFIEIEGSADMALEIVSHSSVGKDKEKLREVYHRAGVREYWLVDVRYRRARTTDDEPQTEQLRAVQFHILVHTPDGYVAAETVRGWQRSDVFDRSFRLKRGVDPLGHPQFTLEVR